MGFGYLNTKTNVENMSLKIIHYQEAAYTIDKVIAVHSVKRDSVMLSLPLSVKLMTLLKHTD